MSRDFTQNVFELMQGGLQADPEADLETLGSLEATSNQPVHELIAILNKHPHIQSLQDPHYYSQPLPIDDEQLMSRSRDYAAYAIRRAVRLGLLADKHKISGQPVNLDAFAHRIFLLRGQDHYLTGIECQDEVVVSRDEDSIIAVVCDGAGAFELSHFGSRLIAREALKVFKAALQAEASKNVMGGSFLNRNFLADVHYNLYRAVHDIVCELALHPGHAYKTFLATTLQVLIITPKESAILALGDGFIRWNGKFDCISDRTMRPSRLRRANHPPLLICGLAFDAGSQPIRKSDSEIKLALHTEAMNFEIVAYGPTADLMERGLEMSSDGLRFCDEVTDENEEDATLFPLHKLLDKHPISKVADMANLFNLAGEVEEGETKLALILEVLGKNANGDDRYPEISHKLKSFVTDQFARYLNSDAKLRTFLERASGLEAVKFLNGNHAAAKDGQQAMALLEHHAVDLAVHTVTRVWGIPNKGFVKPMWDDVGLIQIIPTSGKRDPSPA